MPELAKAVTPARAIGMAMMDREDKYLTFVLGGEEYGNGMLAEG